MLLPVAAAAAVVDSLNRAVREYPVMAEQEAAVAAVLTVRPEPVAAVVRVLEWVDIITEMVVLVAVEINQELPEEPAQQVREETVEAPHILYLLMLQALPVVVAAVAVAIPVVVVAAAQAIMAVVAHPEVAVPAVLHILVVLLTELHKVL